MNSFYILCFLLSITAICAQYKRRITTEEIKALRKDLLVTRGYDKNALPIPPNDQLRVSIYYSLISLRNFDLKSQTLTVDGWLEYNWHDESLRWDNKPEWKHIDVIRMPAEEVYIPDVMLYNGGDFTTTKLSQTKVLVYTNGHVLWVPPMTHIATCKADLRKWPYDEHICQLKFGSWTHDGYVMDVKASNKSDKHSLSDLFESSEFDIKFINVTNRDTTYPCCKEPYPSVTFYYKLQRKPTLYHYIISMPTLVAIITSLVTFWFPIRSKLRFVLNGISLLTLTLLLIHLGTVLGFSSFRIPFGVRFLSLTALFIGIIQIWFTIAYNISLVKSKVPLWSIKLTQPLVHLYKNPENEGIHLTQTDQSPDVSKQSETPTAADVTFLFDKLIFVVFALGLAINSLV